MQKQKIEMLFDPKELISYLNDEDKLARANDFLDEGWQDREGIMIRAKMPLHSTRLDSESIYEEVKTRFDFIQTPGHGWLVATLDDIQNALNPAKFGSNECLPMAPSDFSSYSFKGYIGTDIVDLPFTQQDRDGEPRLLYFLEEDADFTMFADNYDFVGAIDTNTVDLDWFEDAIEGLTSLKLEPIR